MKDCETCENEFKPRNPGRRFCSRACYVDSLRGTIPPGGFTPGRPSSTKCAVGTVRIRTRHGRGGVKRAWVKVAEPNKWRLRAHVVYEKTHPPVGEGFRLHHIDRDTLNDSPDNLEAVSIADHLREHHAETVAARRAAGSYKVKRVSLTCSTCESTFQGCQRAKYCPACRKDRAKAASRRQELKRQAKRREDRLKRAGH